MMVGQREQAEGVEAGAEAETHILNSKHEAESTNYLESFNSQSLPLATLSPTRPGLLNTPKQCYKLGAKHSNVPQPMAGFLIQTITLSLC